MGEHLYNMACLSLGSQTLPHIHEGGLSTLKTFWSTPPSELQRIDTKTHALEGTCCVQSDCQYSIA